MKYKTILVSDTNYQKLKQFGSVGNSFNDVVTKLLEERQEMLRNE